ncbi:TonB-dependent receptor domain-containing protein [Daejeonella lutea]|uniref:Outer membrane receptor proteins, mostly Fe transport n=1 Tax=Daejeonella lutea TaxID=572036 RepID=A0A1T5F517_9SPHI|nr:TonB-dependent receptor [Daejeonella lutea]SKB91236.1 Outer membrane receptor proteins, mostly Fe transport [Daejeonella lutea]
MKSFSLNSFIAIICVSVYISSALAQETSSFQIKGTLSASGNQKTDDVTMHLLKAEDKKLIKMEFPDDAGNFVFDRIPASKYLLITQSMNFEKYQSDTISLRQNIDLGKINLIRAENSLKEVVVTAARPLIQQQYDKTVINVASSLTAVGSTALEVLEKAPGITVDQNDNIAMRGRQGVLVMIDGKLVPMSGQDLANMLRSMSAEQIEKIDLITNPSAKYDASGNSGIIDIRLKKGNNVGTNGSLSLSYGQGVYSKLNPSLNFNSRSKKLNVFGSYNYGYREDFNDLTIFRNFYTPSNQLTGGNNYVNYFQFAFNNHNLRLGADYNLGKKAILGFTVNGISNKGNVDADSRAKSFNATNQATGSFNTVGTNSPERTNTSYNLNYKHTLDSGGKELSADLDYARFRSDEIQNYTTNYYGLNDVPSRTPYKLLGDLSGLLDIRSFKIDYNQPLKAWNGRFEAGLKSSWVESDNNVAFYDRSNGSDILDAGKSNHFIYNENINAAYVNTSGKWKKLNIQLGLRLENTVAEGVQLKDNSNFDRNYTQLFPSGYLGYRFSENNDLGISLSRRINRPSYRQLNPFKVFLDPATSSAGNPFLKPELTNSFELTHTLKQKFITKIGYSRTTDNILSVLSPDTEPNTVLQTGRNLAKFDYYNFSFGFPISVGKWLNSTNNALLYYGRYSGNLVNTNLNAGRTTFTFNSNNNFVVNNTVTAEFIGNYQGKSTYGFLEIDPIWSMGLGVQKQLFDKKASLKLNVSDVFFTNGIDAFTLLSGYGEHFLQTRDTRVGTLSFTYRFGKTQVPGSRRRSGGAEDEKRRAG